MVGQAFPGGNRRIGSLMKKTLSLLRATASVILLAVGLSAYAARLDPIQQHISTLGPAGSPDTRPADNCTLPCQAPSLDRDIG